MPDLRISTQTGEGTTVIGATIDGLQNSLRGKLLTFGTPGFDEARTIWNAMIDRCPALIVRATSTDDVVQAVRFAAPNDLMLSIRGGGHNIAGNAVCDGGVMIDLSLMNQVDVDPAARRAWVGGGARLGDVDSATQAYGLVTPLGINSTTGVAGLTLGGGFGWLSRRFGLTVDNLVGAEVVTSWGEVVRASDEENQDLFWAIRGGGGNFGVVTNFEYRLHEIGTEVFAGLVIHELDSAPDVLRFYRDFVASTPENVACWFVMRQAPPLPFLDPKWHGKHILALAICITGDLRQAESLSMPIRQFGSPIGEHIGPVPYVAWQQALDPLLTPGARNYWKSHDFMNLSDAMIDVLIDYARRIPDPQTEIAWAQLGGAVARVPSNAMAYARRNAEFVLNLHVRWADPNKDQECITWARSLFDAATPYSTGGVYVNFMTQEETDRVEKAYGPNFDQLVQLKNRYDPTNLFRMNQNIRPTVRRGTRM